MKYVGHGQASLEVWERMVRGNLVLPGAVVGMVAGLMAERGHGRIVLFGGPGSDALRGYTSITPYAAAKAGLGDARGVGGGGLREFERDPAL